MFENIIGNDRAKKTLFSIKEPSHAYIFLGIEGIGKLLFAKEFAYKWLCESEIRPCGECKSCRQYKSGNSMDLEIVEPDGDSIKVKQIRDMIKKVYEKPTQSNRKIYIINDADKMTPAAQNALLKILEEPPTYVIMILIGSNEHLFLNTIKSRCIKIIFNELGKEELSSYIRKNNMQIDERLLDLCAGSIGKIPKIKAIENELIELESLLTNVKNMSKIEFYKRCITVVTKENFVEILEYLNTLVFKLWRNGHNYLGIINRISLAMNQFKKNCNAEMVLDNLILDIYDFII